MTTTDRPIRPAPRNMSVPQPRAGADVFDPIEEPPPPDEAPRKPTVTFTLHALIDDFPFDVQFSGSADQLKATIARLRELGAIPPTPAARLAVEAEKAREAPVCQYHGPMKESTKAPGTWYCTKRMGDGSYCKERA